MSAGLCLFTDNFKCYSPTAQELVDSHALCLKLGLQKKQKRPKNVLPLPLIRKVKYKQRPYLTAVLPMLLNFYRDLPNNFVCFLTDQQLINLHTIGSQKVRTIITNKGSCLVLISARVVPGPVPLPYAVKQEEPYLLLGRNIIYIYFETAGASLKE